jgi:protein transport protein SEC13
MFCFIVNTVAWAPYEYGLMLACGSSDGSISIISSTGRNEVLIDC